MSAADDLARYRKRRADARRALKARIERVQGELGDAPVSTLIKRKAKADAVRTLDKGKAIALENKPVIAGTIAALAAWFLREQLRDLALGAWDTVRTWRKPEPEPVSRAKRLAHGVAKRIRRG